MRPDRKRTARNKKERHGAYPERCTKRDGKLPSCTLLPALRRKSTRDAAVSCVLCSVGGKCWRYVGWAGQNGTAGQNIKKRIF